ncbi:MAG: hypothetical protein Q4F97_01265 [Bacteroidales bacterium]|nr:hypothetical protein [Bacteroidales bacterium]
MKTVNYKNSLFKCIAVAVLLLYETFNLFSQDIEHPHGWIVPAWYSKPFVCEIESPLNKTEIGFGRGREEYTPMENGESLYVPYLNVDLGTTIPIYSGHIKDKWLFSIDIPISFHLWLDMKTNSAPVLNTDYRFAVGELKLLRYLNKTKYIKNISFRYAPLNHESTHIGDELTIRRKLAGYPITRVNVSYEYSEIAACINDPTNKRDDNHALKVGLMVRIPNGTNWYKIYPNEGDSIFNSKMGNLTEYYFEYEWQRKSKLFKKDNILSVLSLEIRNRAKYKYPTISWSEYYHRWEVIHSKHSRAWCFNLYCGLRIFPKFLKYEKNLGMYIHAYYGIVPYGQFRNTSNYSYLGFSFVVDV